MNPWALIREPQSGSIFAVEFGWKDGKVIITGKRFQGNVVNLDGYRTVKREAEGYFRGLLGK